MPVPVASATLFEKKKSPFTLLPSHEVLLQSLSTLHLATAAQVLQHNHYSSGSYTAISARLKQLEDAGFLLHLKNRPLNSPRVYFLARKGLNYLRSVGIEVRDYFRPSQEAEKGDLFLKHTLAVNDFIIAATKVCWRTPGFCLSRLLHERVLKRSPIRVAFPDACGQAKTLTFVPDALLEFVRGDTSFPFLVEVDRGTVEQKQFRRKIRAYMEFIRQKQYKAVFELKKAATIIFPTTAGQRRLLQMREWTRKECAATQEKAWLANLFVFTAFEPQIQPESLFFDPVWFLPFQDKCPVTLLGE